MRWELAIAACLACACVGFLLGAVFTACHAREQALAEVAEEFRAARLRLRSSVNWFSPGVSR